MLNILDSICLDGLISGSNLSNLSRWASGLDISKFGIPDSRGTYSRRIHALRSNRMRFIFTNLGFSKLEGAPSDGQREALSVATARSAVRYSRPPRWRRQVQVPDSAPLLQARSEKAAS